MNSTNTNESGFSIKAKRDEYLVEIRKTKSNDILRTKRNKLNKIQPDSDLNAMPPLTELAVAFSNELSNQNIDGVLRVLEMIRTHISKDDSPPLTELIGTGIVPKITELLAMDLYHYEKLIMECSWICANIASGDSDHTDFLVDLDIIPKALDLLKHENLGINENALWILANIAGESLTDRDTIIKCGAVIEVDNLLSRNPTLEAGFIANVTFLMSNLCRGKPYPDFPEIAAFLPYLENFIKKNKEEETQINCMWAVSYISNGDDSQVQEVLNMDILKEVFESLYSSNYKLVVAGLKVLGNICSGEDDYTQMLLNNDLLGEIFPCLGHTNKIVRKNSYWVISNILAGSSMQVKEVFEFKDGEIIRFLFEAIQREKQEAEEALYALTNAADSGALPEVALLVKSGIIELLLEVIRNTKSKVIMRACMNSLDNILLQGDEMTMEAPEDSAFFKVFNENGGMALLEKLQGFPDKAVFNSIEKILNRYKDA